MGCRRRWWLASTAGLALAMWSDAASAQALCTQLQGQAGLLLCEDWEDPLWFEVSAAAGTWIDDNGTGTYRGIGSLWTQRYGASGGSCAWTDGEPANPTLGVTCDLSGGGQACFPAALMPNDEFQAPTTSWVGPLPTPPAGASPPNYACLKPVNDASQLDSEGLGLTGPSTLPFGGVVALRVPQGNGASTWPNGNELDRAAAAIVGAVNWPAVTEIGVTMAVAYSSNAGTSGVFDAPWKHDEYGDGDSNIEFWFSGNTGTGGPEQLPFSPFRFATAGCDAALAAATVLAGNFDCSNGVSLRYSPDPGAYTQSVDWPWGTWGCVRAYQRGMGTSAMELYVKFQGPNDSAERTLMHLTGFDGTTLANQQYSGFVWNHYANVNQAAGTNTNAPTYRFEDNVVVVGGREPLTCAEIGFTSGSGGGGVGGGGSGGGSSSGTGAGFSDGPADAEDESGCGCRLVGAPSSRGEAEWLLLLFAALTLVHERRTRWMGRFGLRLRHTMRHL